MTQSAPAGIPDALLNHGRIRVVGTDNETAGRSVVSLVDLAEGAVVLRTNWFAFGVGDKYKRFVCHVCLSSDERKWTIACPTCNGQVFFCSERCLRIATKQQSQHQAGGECRALRRLHALQQAAYKAPTGRGATSVHYEYRNTWDQVRLCIMIVAQYVVEQKRSVARPNEDADEDDALAHTIGELTLADAGDEPVLPSTFSDVMCMMDRRDLLTPGLRDAASYIVDTALACFDPHQGHRGRLRQHAPAMASSSSSWSPPMPPHLLREAFLRVRCNSFNVLDEDWYPIGVAMFPLASFFNHRCEANCKFLYGNGHGLVVASQQIKAGDELVLCYTAEDESYDQRQAYLSQHYYFTCRCATCCHDATKLVTPAKVDHVLEPNTSGT